MKILAIGDFHGKFPEKLKKLVKKEKIDLVISLGDYCPFIYRKIWFEHCYGKNIELWEIIGKAKMKRLVEKDLERGKRVLKQLNNLNLPVFTVIGNLDYANLNDQYQKEKWARSGKWKWYGQDFFSKIIKKYKNIKRFDYKAVKFGGLVLVGGFGHTSPGDVKSKAYKKHRQKLESLFKRFGKENKEGKVIFVTHNMPYDTLLDKIKDKEADERVRGKHYGAKLIRRIISKHQPVLHLGGHHHENQGKCKIGKTIVVNTGAAKDGKAVIIDFDEKKKKVNNVKFVR